MMGNNEKESKRRKKDIEVQRKGREIVGGPNEDPQGVTMSEQGVWRNKGVVARSYIRRSLWQSMAADGSANDIPIITSLMDFVCPKRAPKGPRKCFMDSDCYMVMDILNEWSTKQISRHVQVDLIQNIKTLMNQT
ncbi:hypothetical protein E2542_SST01145 [Spatholobus suberectus]|nr:hypothetical protein E2542_SST01145 [Spatholobus suberectus]